MFQLTSSFVPFLSRLCYGVTAQVWRSLLILGLTQNISQTLISL
ncbi:MAG: hypothetical protein V7K46_07800 [Nostoc sp.]